MYTLTDLDCAKAAIARAKKEGNPLLLWPMDLEIALYAIECLEVDLRRSHQLDRERALRKRARARVIRNSNSQLWITSSGKTYSRILCGMDAAIEEEIRYLRGEVNE